MTDWDVASVVTLIHKRQSFYPPPFSFEENFDEQVMNVTKKQRTNN